MMRRSLLFTAPGVVTVREEPRPSPGPGEVLVASVMSAISAGTERLIYSGEAPQGLTADQSISSLSGTLVFPLKYGYATVGRVVQVGSDVDRAWLDRLVLALHPHESHFVVSPSVLHPLPAGVSPEQALFLPNLETAVSLVMDGEPVIGEQVAVFGQGVVGLLTTSVLAGLPLSSLVTFDAHRIRRDRSVALGALASFDPAAPEVLAAGRRALQAERSHAGADLTIECSGNPEALDQAIAVTGVDGRVIVASWYGRRRVDLDLGGSFHRSGIRLVSSQVSRLSPRWRGRWTKARRLDVAWSYAAATDAESLITHRFGIDEAPEAYRLLDEAPDRALQVVFRYDE